MTQKEIERAYQLYPDIDLSITSAFTNDEQKIRERLREAYLRGCKETSEGVNDDTGRNTKKGI